MPAIKAGEYLKLPMPIGVNADAVALALPPDDSPAMENVRLEKGSIRARLGETAYINKAYNNISSGIRSMHRYRKEDGTRKVVVHSNIYVYGDSNDDGNFDLISSVAPSADGLVNFTQYRNTLGIMSELVNPLWYNSSTSPASIQPTLVPIDFSDGLGGLLNATNATTGGRLLDKFYAWRITFDIDIAGDFLGETQASGVTTAGSPTGVFNNHSADWTGGTGNDNKVDFKRPSNATVDAVPAYVKRINFYRSPPLDAALSAWHVGVGANLEDTNLYRIGSVDMATVRVAAFDSVIFTDDGTIPLGPETPQISYGVRWYPIRPRYSVFHKGRLWMTYCNVSKNTAAASYVLDVDGVYYTRFIANGVEPIINQITSPSIELDPYSGEGNTGLASWRNKVLLAFKAHATHVIYGGDDSISATIPNIQREILSPTVGCIAPRTIVQAEQAVMWVSHRGPEIFDGTGPRPLNSDKIRPHFDLIPASRKRAMVAYYDSKDREYVIFYTHIGEVKNRHAFVYSFITKEWTINRYERGIGAVLEVSDSDIVRRVLFAYDDDSSYFNTFDNDPIIVYGKSQYKSGVKEVTPLTWGLHFPPTDFGYPVLSKNVNAVRVEGHWKDDVNVSFVVYHKDGVMDTTIAPIPIPAPVNGRGLSEEVPIPASLAISGQHIETVVSGTTSTGQTDITGVYLKLTPVGEA